MKKSIQTCELCNSKKEIVFEGDGVQYPVFSCPKHGKDERNEWQIWWDVYHHRWKEKEYWHKPKDKPSCVLGYFCNKFEEFYGYSYTFDYINPLPYKSKDFIITRRILTMFGGNAVEIKTYIRWVFAKKVKTTKYTVTSIGFFASSAFVNEYKAAKARSLVLRRSTKLPKQFLEWCKDKYPMVIDSHGLETWNDLNGLVTFVSSYGKDNEEHDVVLEAIAKGMLPKEGYIKLED